MSNVAVASLLSWFRGSVDLLPVLRIFGTFRSRRTLAVSVGHGVVMQVLIIGANREGGRKCLIDSQLASTMDE